MDMPIRIRFLVFYGYHDHKAGGAKDVHLRRGFRSFRAAVTCARWFVRTRGYDWAHVFDLGEFGIVWDSEFNGR